MAVPSESELDADAGALLFARMRRGAGTVRGGLRAVRGGVSHAMGVDR
jgi:hypothetical protein